MKSIFLPSLLATIPLTNALGLVKRDTPSALSAPIQRKHYTNPAARDQLRKERRLNKRSSTVSETITNDLTLYWANVTIGTPAQSISLHIDTGSSDLWVNAPNSTLCEQYAQDCDSSGVYTATSSSTYAYVNSNFNITYADSSGAAGIYATDDVTFGGVTLDNLQFGIGYTSTSTEGVLGIGYITNEASTEFDKTYSNLPVALVSAGYIETNAYSLWLDDLDASTGTILFGGINTAKYSGTLETLPIIKEDGEYAEFLITLTAFGSSSNTTSLISDSSLAALLDSGTSLTYLPDAVVETLYDTYDATYSNDLGAAIVNCDLASSTDSFVYTFSGVEISVPMNELVLVAGEEQGKDVCIFGIGSAGEDTVAILGDTFLRSAYVVYDLTSNEISLAQANYNSDADDIVDITSSGVPSASTVTNAVSTAAASATGVNRVDAVTSSAAAPMITFPPLKAYAALAAAGMGAVLAF